MTLKIKIEENTGDQFNIDHYLRARELTINAVQSLSKKISPGMNEEQCFNLLKIELDLIGVEKYWHPSKFRINANTTKNFRDDSEDLALHENDLFFIDIGPVFYNHEADYGETFILGNDEKLLNLQRAPKLIFEATQEYWKNNNKSGAELYEFASNEASKFNLKLNSNMYGHRLGDFPHALHHKGKLGHLDYSPSPHLWVLEIHLIDENLNRGAFFEDILI